MAQGEEDKSQKTEPPSPFKLEEARKKGNVFKSNELLSWLAVFAGVLLILSIGRSFIEGALSLCRQMLLGASSFSFAVPALHNELLSLLGEGVNLVGPIMFVMLLVGVLASVIQTGLVFSFEQLKPDFKRLNPVEGIKRVFSIRLLFETGKSTLKLAVVFFVAFIFLRANIVELLRMHYSAPREILDSFIAIATQLMLVVLAATLIFVILDFIFVRWQYLKKLRMSHREIKEEVKRREGDPQVKAKRKEIEKELRKKSESASRTAGADLVVVNPTRYAVAIKYDRSTMIAPIVVAKGVGGTANAIREVAYKHSVPVFHLPPLARKLYRGMQIDGALKEEFYPAVAKLYAELYGHDRSSATRAGV